MALFRGLATDIVQSLEPESVLDVGCAAGMLVEALHERGVDAHGIDGPGAAVPGTDDRCRVQELTDPIKGDFDLITCIEVVQRLRYDEASGLIANLCGATDSILFSSTSSDPDERSGPHVRPPEDWSVVFAANGFVRDTDFDASFVSPWAALYRRASTGTEDVVRHYDRAWSTLRNENRYLRSALVDPAVTRRIASAGVDEASEVVAALEREKLVLRDELIGARRRAGELSGRVVELEAQLLSFAPLWDRHGDLQREYDDLLDRNDELQERLEDSEARYRAVVESTTWRASWKLMGPYRRLRAMFGRPGN